jgi:hypothetical protein
LSWGCDKRGETCKGNFPLFFLKKIVETKAEKDEACFNLKFAREIGKGISIKGKKEKSMNILTLRQPRYCQQGFGERLILITLPI